MRAALVLLCMLAAPPDVTLPPKADVGPPPLERPSHAVAIREAVRAARPKLEKCLQPDAGQSQCVCQTLRNVRFPTLPDGGTLTVSYPMMGKSMLSFTLDAAGSVIECR